MLYLPCATQRAHAKCILCKREVYFLTLEINSLSKRAGWWITLWLPLHRKSHQMPVQAHFRNYALEFLRWGWRWVGENVCSSTWSYILSPGELLLGLSVAGVVLAVVISPFRLKSLSLMPKFASVVSCKLFNLSLVPFLSVLKLGVNKIPYSLIGQCLALDSFWGKILKHKFEDRWPPGRWR